MSRWSKPNEADLLIDESFNGEYAFHTDFQESPWWQVDLGCAYKVDHLRIENRRTTNVSLLEKAKNFDLLISLNGREWELVHRNELLFSKGDDSLILEVLRDTRFLRIQLREKNYFHLGHLKVFVRHDDALEGERKSVYLSDFREKLGLKIAVLGTSNSRKKYGYTSVLNEAFLTVDNISIGSSHPVICAESLERLDGNKYDFLLIDFNVNEQRAYNANLYDFEKAKEAYKFILSWCHSFNVTPIVLIFPHLDCFKENNTSQVGRKKILRLCQKYNLPFVDGYEFVTGEGQKHNRQISDMFEDSAHLSNFSAQKLGGVVKNGIQNVMFALLRRQISCDYVTESGFLLSCHEIRSSKIVERRTSAITLDYAHPELGEVLNFRIASRTALWGVSLNMAKTNCALKVFNESRDYCKRLDNVMFDPERDVWHACWQLIESPEFDNDVNLLIEPVSNKAELNDHSVENKEALQRPVTAELKSLILAQPSILDIFRFKVETYFEFNLNLHTKCR